MWKLPANRSETAFPDGKAPYDTKQAVAEASRCLYCYDAPCQRACPTSIDIPEFIRRIATGNERASAKTIFDSNILGASCARVCPVEVLCVGDCVHNAAGVPPIQIGRLQRYATETAVANGWRFFEAGPSSGRKVALVGAGPASLAAAHELRRQGHAVTIYERAPLPGGLNVTGVAPYKIPAHEALAELEWVLGIGGVEVVTGVEVGKDVALADLEKTHDAVFVGIGLGPDRMLPGHVPTGVYGAVAWIERMKLGRVDLAGVVHAVVVGGGNTAIDCVRELVGLGVPCVTMAYRGTEAKMSGYKHEWDAAKKQGARAAWEATPVGYVGEDRVRAVRLRAPNGAEWDEPAELVLVAIGQSKLGGALVDLGIETDNGVIRVDADGATTRRGWYAGGDCSNGGKEVVNAVAEGKRAAIAIDRYLSGATG
ncbi:MAG: FAD-dependent oxidoreductase [Myxococcota bacterium]